MPLRTAIYGSLCLLLLLAGGCGGTDAPEDVGADGCDAGISIGEDVPLIGIDASSGADAGSGADASDLEPDAGDRADSGSFDAGEEPDPCGFEMPGARWIAYSSRKAGQFDIWLVRADGSCPRQVTNTPGDDLFPDWSPSGETLAYVSARDGRYRIFRYELASGDETEIEIGELNASYLSHSPDGQHLVFEGGLPGQSRNALYKVSVTGGTVVRLGESVAIEAAPVWSPDGTRIYFVSTASGQYEIWSMAGDGTDRRKLTTGSRILGRPVVSPDGTTLVHGRKTSGDRPELVRFELATSQVTSLGQEAGEPAFESTGERLVVTYWGFGNPEIVTMGYPVAGALQRVTEEEAADSAPAFRP